jgi:hypothetical protein
MAEAIAAFSLAANVVQFIDFGCNFVSTAWNIYRHGHPGEGKFLDLQTVTNDLKIIVDKLQPKAAQGCTETREHDGLFKLSEECQLLALEMLASLSNIIISNKGRKRDAIKHAFRVLWKEEKIKSVQARLDGFRSQLMLHLLASLR